MTDPSAHDALQRRLHGLREALLADVEVVAPLRAVEARWHGLHDLLDDLDRQLERVRRAAVITLVGATGAGKSTLLNALAGAPIASEGENRPTTTAPVVHAPHDADLGALLGELPGAPPRVVHYEPAGRSPWTEQILIDAPDINSVAAEHREVVAALAGRSDVLVVVLHRQSIVEEASVSFVDAFAGRRELLFVLNRADELSEESREELLAQLRRLAAERWRAPEAPVLSVSARLAQSQPNASGWGELCGALRGLASAGALEGVRRHNALGTARRLQDEFAAVAEEAGEDLADLPALAAGGMERLAARTAEETRARLRLRRADLSHLLWSEAAKRWDGPGGWALRGGGLSSLGLGAGALIARRNPLIAVGAAGAAVAADKVQKVARGRRLAGAEVLLPAPGDFAAWHAESLSEARLCAARLAGDTSAFGVPDAAEASAAASAAVSEAWDDLVDRDLPRAAETSGLRWFHLPLDLPVYALGLWLVWKAAGALLAELGTGVREFFGNPAPGEYVGIDMLLNAALLLAVYLFVVRLVVRRLLAGRASGLLRSVTSRADESLARAAAGTRTGVEAATARTSEALQRLGTLEKTWREALERG